MTYQYFCTICHGPIKQMGIDGVFDDEQKPVHDKCVGVERDKNGYAWYPGEAAHIYVDLNGENPHTITREEAFGLVKNG